MYTSKMQKVSGTPRWWDWVAIAVLFVLVEIPASRLVTTNWTEFLFIGQTTAYIGYTLGVALGYSRFAPKISRWISFLYMLIFLPLQWTQVIDQSASLEEQFLSVGGRMFYSYADFFANRPVEDPLFFITLISVGFWIIGASAGFQLVRRQNYLAVVMPSAIVLFVIQGYDNRADGRVWIIAFFAFMALLLLGRLQHLANRESWRERRIFLSPDNNVDLISIMTVAAGLLILFSWVPPASASGMESAVQAWNRITRPWREFTESMENAISALETPSGGIRGEFYGSEIALGRGFPLSDAVMFRVQAPDLPEDQTPPRYYWRGYTYDLFDDGQWYTTGSGLRDYAPGDDLRLQLPQNAYDPARFVFQTGTTTFGLVYAPAEPVWFSRQGATRNLPAEDGQEVVSWYASPALRSGEIYQMDVVLSNPNTRQLRDAGQAYPAWITNKYLQLPKNFSPRIAALAEELTAGFDNPYDKSLAVTRYLRDNIEYADILPQPPRNRDPLEWMLFENKKAYCMYYASAQVLMLRSQGIPARLAVGFAQGELIEAELFQEERTWTEYIVRKLNAHAWPEVYFPGIGWVEFEPTGSQPALDRPFPPRDPSDLGAPLRELPQLMDDTELLQEQRALQDDETASGPGLAETRTINPGWYLALLFIALAALTIYFSRRYAVPERMPALLRTAYERNGANAPAWIVNWERWVGISTIEKAFESINFSLRLLDSPLPPHATPNERAQSLGQLLPQAKSEITALLDEHQTSLYTSRTADASRAKRAAFRIRFLAVKERVRVLVDGGTVESP